MALVIDVARLKLLLKKSFSLYIFCLMMHSTQNQVMQYDSSLFSALSYVLMRNKQGSPQESWLIWICLNAPSCFGDISRRRRCPRKFCFSEGESVEHLNERSLRDPHGELISFPSKFTSHPRGPSWLSSLPSPNLIAEYLARNKAKQKINPCHALIRD